MLACVGSLRGVSSFLGCVLLLSCVPDRSSGQTAAAAPSPAGHGSAGGGLILGATADEANRVRFPDTSGDGDQGSLWVLSGHVFVSRHVAVGMEYVTLGTVNGRTDPVCCVMLDSENERVIYGTGRFSSARPGRVNLDLVGGVGILSQHRRTSVSDRWNPGVAATVTVDDREDPCFVLGADVPIRIASHFVVSPIVRLYFLERKTIDTLTVTATSPRRLVFGVTAGVKW